MEWGKKIAVAIGLSLAVAGCGSSSPRERVAAAKPTESDFESLQTGPTSSASWIAGRLPDGYEFVWAGDNRGPAGLPEHASSYSRTPTQDISDAPLSVFSTAASAPLPKGRSTTVRGHPAVISTLTDEGRAYGVSLTWHERKGLTIAVSADEGLSLAEAQLVAAHVRPVSADTWHRLVIAADYIGRAAPDMTRVPVTSGQVGGYRWALTALIPPGYPVLPVDRRFACYELDYRGQRSNGSACWQHPSWVRLAGQVFVFGEASPEVHGVTVRRAGKPDVHAQAHLTSRWPRASFWVAPMPNGTCTVNLLPADHAAASDPHTLGTTGPLDDSTADQTRCTGAPVPPHQIAPTTAPNGSGPPTTSVATTSVTSAPAPYAPTTQ